MKTMLIADDSAFTRKTIKIFAEKAEIKVVAEAANGTEAIEKYKEHTPTVVTMDYAMDEANGIQATRAILEINPKAVIILISSLGAQTAIAHEALATGVKTVMKKPLDSNEFISFLLNLPD